MREHQRSQHNEDAKGQRAERGDQHVSDRLEPQQNPVSRLQFAIGAVEADAQALDSAGGEIDREHGADRERAGVGVGQHVVNFPRDRQRYFLGPGC